MKLRKRFECVIAGIMRYLHPPLSGTFECLSLKKNQKIVDQEAEETISRLDMIMAPIIAVRMEITGHSEIIMEIRRSGGVALILVIKQ